MVLLKKYFLLNDWSYQIELRLLTFVEKPISHNTYSIL